MAKEDTNKVSLKERAQAVYNQAPDTIIELEAAFIFTSGSATRRDFPKYDSSEIKTGEILGKGGFSNVREVLDIQLSDDDKIYNADDDDDDHQKQQQQQQQHKEVGERTDKRTGATNDHNHHYEVSTARAYMATHTQRLGSARYAIKRLKDDLDELERARGALDLAIEIKLMSAFWHPNIVKMRGISRTDIISADTFM